MRYILPMNIDPTGYRHTKDLLAGPKWLGLDDGWYGDYTIPFGDP